MPAAKTVRPASSALTARVLRSVFAVPVNGVTRHEVKVDDHRAFGGLVEIVREVDTLRQFAVLTPAGERARMTLLAG